MIHATLSDMRHHDDDLIEVTVTVFKPRRGCDPLQALVVATVASDFWENSRVTDFDKCLLPGPAELEDVEKLVVLVHELLSPSLRELGTDFVEAV